MHISTISSHRYLMRLLACYHFRFLHRAVRHKGSANKQSADAITVEVPLTTAAITVEVPLTAAAAITVEVPLTAAAAITVEVSPAKMIVYAVVIARSAPKMER